MTEVIFQRSRDPSVLPPLNSKSRRSTRHDRGGGSAGGQHAVAAALRILDPARKKLDSVETQRIVACLDEAIRRHELLSILPIIESQLSRYSVSLGSELVDAIEIHKEKCTIYDEVKTFSRDANKLDRLLHDVIESCKNVMRQFGLNPSVAASLRDDLIHDSTQRCITELDASILGGQKELRAIMLELLLTTPIEETDRSSYLEKVSTREQNNSAVIEKLQAKLDMAIADKEQETSKKTEVIRKLKNDLFQIEQFSEEHIRRTKSEAVKHQNTEIKNSEGKQATFRTEIQQLEDKLAKMMQEHRTEEQSWRKKKYKIETEVENWIQKYDLDMGERQDLYEKIDAVYTTEKKQLRDLEYKFKTLGEEYDKIMEERRIARVQKEFEERELANRMKAAVTIQAYFRAYKVRKALAGKSKKGGKKGKKGKKK